MRSSSELSFSGLFLALEGLNLAKPACLCLSEAKLLEKESSSLSQEAFSLFSSFLRAFLLRFPVGLSGQRKDGAQLGIEPPLAC